MSVYRTIGRLVMVTYVMAHILLSSEMCSASLEKSRKLIKPHCCDREQQCLLHFYSQTQALEVCDMYGMALYLLNNLTSSLLYATALFLS